MLKYLYGKIWMYLALIWIPVVLQINDVLALFNVKSRQIKLDIHTAWFWPWFGIFETNFANLSFNSWFIEIAVRFHLYFWFCNVSCNVASPMNDQKTDNYIFNTFLKGKELQSKCYNQKYKSTYFKSLVVWYL